MLFWGWFCWAIGCMFLCAIVSTPETATMGNIGVIMVSSFVIPFFLVGALCISKALTTKSKQSTSQNNTTTTLHKTYQVPTLTDEQINQIVSKCKTELFSQTTLDLLGKSISNKLQFEITTAIQKRQEENLENEISYGRLPTEQEKRKERNKMTDKLRNEILTRDNHTCKNCGLSRAQEPHLCLHVDHIIPISKGGKTHEKNLQTLCWECNLKKGNKTEI